MYNCEFCGCEYETPLERSQCVLKCHKAQQEKEIEIEKANLRKERMDNRKLIRQKINEVQNLIEEYNKKFAKEVEEFTYFPNRIRPSLMPNGLSNFEFLRFT